jgi:hypothetical protein
MPTPHKRIFVTQDTELSDALLRVRAHYPGVPPARLVHDLAVRGAEVVSREKVAEDEAIERLVAFSLGGEDAVDWSVVERIDELAWGE